MRRWLTFALLLLPGPLYAQAHPYFFADSASTTRWAAWKANYEANPSSPSLLGGQIYKRIKTDADSGARYMDKGQLGAWMYHVTGDSGYVTKAWTQINAATEAHNGGGFLNRPETCNNSGVSGNYSRGNGWELVLMYDWLYPGLDAGQRTTFLNKLKVMAACVSAPGGPAGWSFLASDTDQTTGDYMMMAMMEASIGSYDATINGYWNDATRKIGGYASTATDYATRRNALKSYMAGFAAGGEWMEGTEYNIGTMKLLLIPSAALRTLQSPTDNYSDITAWQQDAAEQFIHLHTPGVNAITGQHYQWGNVQSARSMMNYYRWETCIALAAVTTGTTIGPKIHDFCLDYLESSTLATIDPYPAGFYVFDPTATRGDHTTLGKTKYSSGQTILLSRTGWTSSDSMFGAQLAPYNSVTPSTGGAVIDHGVSVVGEFQLWKGGAWAITHPIAYGAPADDPRGTNGLTHGGVGAGGSGLEASPREYRKVRQWKEDVANGYVYGTGTVGGSIVPSVYWNMPAQFIMEHTRSLVYLPALDTIVVHDRSNSKLPSAVGTTGYGASAKTWIDSRPRKELYVASPVSPTLGSGYLDWIYSGSSHTRVTNLLPASITRTVEADVDVYTGTYYNLGTIAASEKKYHTIIKPTADQQWDTFLNVWDAYGTATPATVTLVQDTSAKVDASLVTKGATSYLLAFNAIQGADIPTRTMTNGFGYYTTGTEAILDAVRVRKSSYSLTYTATQTTKAVLFDLDHNTAWTYTINGGGSQALTVSAEDIGVIDIANTGSVTLAVLAVGALPVQIQTGSLPAGRKNVAYSQALTSSGGAGSPAWDITVGTLHTGLSLTAGGTITGTPSQIGNKTVTIRACDPSPTNCGTRDFTLNVQDVPDITTLTLPSGNLGTAYSQTLTVSGGTAPYTWTKPSGTYCAGISMSSAGVVSGTPTTLETCTFTVRVTDNAAATDDQVLGITINPALPSLTVRVTPGSTSAVVKFGIGALPQGDSCTVYLKEAEATLDSKVSTSGQASRSVTFTGLRAFTTYGIDVVCGTASLNQRQYFTTVGPATLANYTLKFKPPASILARATTADATLATFKVKVYYTLPSGSTGNVTSTACGGGCSVSIDPVQAGILSCYWDWIVGVGPTTLASTVARPAYVAIP